MPPVEAEADQAALFETQAPPGRRIGKRLTLLEAEGKRALFFGPTAINVYGADDKEAEMACIAILSRAGLASDVDIASAFGIHRNTVGRLSRRFEQQGMAGLVPAKRGPKGPSKVTDEVTRIIAEHAQSPGRELRGRIGRQTGIWLSLPYIYELASSRRPRQLELEAETQRATKLEEPEANDQGASGAVVESSERDDTIDVEVEDVEDEDEGSPSDQHEPSGEDGEGPFEPPLELPKKTSGRYMGLALYYPALAALGLLDIARGIYALPRSVRFGVRATTLCLFFMTILSKTTIETAKHLKRLEFGVMVGSGRAPCVKTLRRKLACLVAQSRAGPFATALARRFVESGVLETAYLYVDGHLKAYSGNKRLQEVWSAKRRMPVPGIHTYFVGDRLGRPVLFVTEELSANLAKAMGRIVASIREVIGDRRFSVIFDRGGYDGALFSWLVGEKIDFITYQRGEARLQDAIFTRRQTRFEGRRRRFMIAEDTKKVGRSGPWRRIVVRTASGHQTPILTSLGAEVSSARVAAVMFARWRQENFFKYASAHHGLDDIVSYAGDLADSEAMVPNPARGVLDRQVAEARGSLGALKTELGDVLLEEPKRGRSAHGLKIAQRGKVGKMRELEETIEILKAQRAKLPKQVSIAEAGIGREVMRREAKAIVDRIKICAYNAEEWLLGRLIVHYRNPFDVRDLLRAFAELSGTIETTATGVVVSLDPPDTPLHRAALRGLVEDLNTTGVTFPGTQVPVTYQVRLHHSELAA